MPGPGPIVWLVLRVASSGWRRAGCSGPGCTRPRLFMARPCFTSAKECSGTLGRAAPGLCTFHSLQPIPPGWGRSAGAPRTPVHLGPFRKQGERKKDKHRRTGTPRETRLQDPNPGQLHMKVGAGALRSAGESSRAPWRRVASPPAGAGSSRQGGSGRRGPARAPRRRPRGTWRSAR